MLLVELVRIPPDQRRDEREVSRGFEAARPRLFGALLDALVGVLRHRDAVRLSKRPRMADFATLACAYAEHAGLGGEQMLNTIMRNAGRQVQEIIESDPLATALVEFAGRHRAWADTPTELYKTLSERRAEKPEDGWPRSARSLGKHLRVLESTARITGHSPAARRTLLGALICLLVRRRRPESS